MILFFARLGNIQVGAEGATPVKAVAPGGIDYAKASVVVGADWL
jgi:hypothetical protein